MLERVIERVVEKWDRQRKGRDREMGDIHRENLQIEGQIKKRERQRKSIDQGIDSKKRELEKRTVEHINGYSKIILKTLSSEYM